MTISRSPIEGIRNGYERAAEFFQDLGPKIRDAYVHVSEKASPFMYGAGATVFGSDAFESFVKGHYVRGGFDAALTLALIVMGIDSEKRKDQKIASQNGRVQLLEKALELEDSYTRVKKDGETAKGQKAD